MKAVLFRLIYTLIITASFVSCNTSSVETNTVKVKRTVKKPNVLLIYMDDLRPQLGCYGNNIIKSPNIDKLASTSVQFNNAYANVPVCGASRASMLTGVYPAKGRYVDYKTFASKDNPNAISFPKLFKQNGYTTISNGKVYHHVDDNPNDFDEVWRPYAFDKNDKGLTPSEYWESIWRDYHIAENAEFYKKTNKGPSTENADVSDSTYIDGIMANKVINDIKKLSKSDKPFFLTAGFISNHLPFNSPLKYWNKYPKEVIKRPYNNYPPKDVPKQAIVNWWELLQYSDIPREGKLDNETSLRMIHGYNATVSYVDVLIGKIMRTLKDEGLDKNTIVVLVADHGYSLEEHTLWVKYNTFKDAAHVPLLIHLPDMMKGTKTDALVELVDLYPTLTELCKIAPPVGQLDGVSLVPILKNTKLEGKDYTFTKTANAFCVRSKRYAYTEFIDLSNSKTISNMLYDYKTDNDENVNVVNKEAYKEIVKEFKKVLRTRFKDNITGN